MKESKDWYIGTTHFLTAGFVMPLLTRWLTVIAFGLLGASGAQSALTVAGVALVGWVLGVWLGVKYSASYLNKTYAAYDKKRVIKQGLYYMAAYGIFVLLALLLVLGLWLSGVIEGASRADIFEGVISLGGVVVSMCLYYIFSMQYIVDKPREMSQGVNTTQYS